jgi:hypothetical protein
MSQEIVLPVKVECGDINHPHFCECTEVEKLHALLRSQKQIGEWFNTSVNRAVEARMILILVIVLILVYMMTAIGRVHGYTSNIIGATSWGPTAWNGGLGCTSGCAANVNWGPINITGNVAWTMSTSFSLASGFTSTGVACYSLFLSCAASTTATLTSANWACVPAIPGATTTGVTFPAGAGGGALTSSTPGGGATLASPTFGWKSGITAPPETQALVGELVNPCANGLAYIGLTYGCVSTSGNTDCNNAWLASQFTINPGTVATFVGSTSINAAITSLPPITISGITSTTRTINSVVHTGLDVWVANSLAFSVTDVIPTYAATAGVGVVAVTGNVAVVGSSTGIPVFTYETHTPLPVSVVGNVTGPPVSVNINSINNQSFVGFGFITQTAPGGPASTYNSYYPPVARPGKTPIADESNESIHESSPRGKGVRGN